MSVKIRPTIASTAGAPGEVVVSASPPSRAADAARILFAGDFCPGADLPQDAAWIATDAGPERGLLPALTASSDVCVVNLECPLGLGDAGRKSGPTLHADPAWARVLRSTGFHAVCLANNHAMDQGEEGLRSTIDAVSGAGLAHFGAGQDLESAARPLSVQAGGRTVAVLAFAEHEFGTAGTDTPGVSPLVPETALRRVRSAREASDAVIVLMHGGNESYPLPRPGLRATCRFLVDSGADAVLCCHSHTIGPVEWYAGAPIVYGLGNLYFPWRATTQPEGWHDSLCVVLEISSRISVHIIPARFSEDRQGVSALSDQEAERVARHVEHLSSTVADDEALERAWAGFVVAHRREYLSALLGLTRLERGALKAGIWPWWRISKRRLPGLLNTVRCESHREALLHLLEEETRRG